MLAIDLQNAIDGCADNFTSKLFQLMFKADAMNIEKLRTVYPVEERMVYIYRCNCPFKDDNTPDFEEIEQRARRDMCTETSQR